jgi:hypothetical protein
MKLVTVTATLPKLRPVFNLAPRYKLWPPGVKLTTSDELCPIGGEDPLFTHPFNYTRLSETSFEQHEFDPGVKLAPGVK